MQNLKYITVYLNLKDLFVLPCMVGKSLRVLKYKNTFYLWCSIPILIPTGMFCIFRLAGKLSILNVYILLLPSKTEPALGFIHHFHSFSFLNHDLTACSFKSLTGDRIGSWICTSGLALRGPVFSAAGRCGVCPLILVAHLWVNPSCKKQHLRLIFLVMVSSSDFSDAGH